MSVEHATTIPSPTDVGALANRINFQTRDMHNKINAYMSMKMAFAMRHGFIYRQGIVAYYYVFHAIEQEIDRLLEHPVTVQDEKVKGILQQFWCEEFRRSDKLVLDLQVLYNDEYPSSEQLQEFLDTFQLPAKLQEFVDEIHSNVQKEPHTILAYCHVLYLALFAGGRVMKSNLYRHIGLFPKFGHLSPKELVRRATNFFTFSEEGVDDENRLRWQYKKGYELATRSELTEAEKLRIIEVSQTIFQRNMEVVAEIGEINRAELMGKFSYKLISFLSEEWKYSEKLTPEMKKLIVFALIVFNMVFVYTILRRLI
ncbi:Hmx1 [Kluyveromyces lactis]|nr:Hmx1 [Kluyveromyces lactis]